MASSGNGPQQPQHVQVAAEGLFARVKHVASGILAEVSCTEDKQTIRCSWDYLLCVMLLCMAVDELPRITSVHEKSGRGLLRA